MQTELEIGDYITKSRQSGLSDDVIRQNLQNAGWKVEDINLALQNQHIVTTHTASISSTTSEITIKYVSFWRRLLALMIDFLVIKVLVQIIFFILTSIFSTQFEIIILKFLNSVSSMIISPDGLQGSLILWAVSFFKIFLSLALIDGLVYLIYKSIFESSRLQATPGKLLVGIKVADINQDRISFFRAFARSIASVLSFVIIIGHLLVFFTKKKQALHDLIAGTIVIDKKQYSSGRLWLIFVLLIVGGLVISAFIPSNKNQVNQVVTETAKYEKKYGLVADADMSKMNADLKALFAIVEKKNYDLITKECVPAAQTTQGHSSSSQEMLTQESILVLNTTKMVFLAMGEGPWTPGQIKGVWLNQEKSSARLLINNGFFDVIKNNDSWTPVVLAEISSCIRALPEKLSQLQKVVRATLPQMPPFELPNSLKDYDKNKATGKNLAVYNSAALKFLSDDYFAKLRKEYKIKYEFTRELNSKTADLEKKLSSQLSFDNLDNGGALLPSGEAFTGIIEVENYVDIERGVYSKSTYSIYIRNGLPVAFEKWDWDQKTASGLQGQSFSFYKTFIGDPYSKDSCLELFVGFYNPEPTIEKKTCSEVLNHFTYDLNNVIGTYLYYTPYTGQ